MDSAVEHVYDLIGVGFGPANLALAIAVDEHDASNGRDSGDGRNGAARKRSAIFLERKDQFSWHQGMLIDDATMQISFMKDLVTIRNPVSRFSFLSYLAARGRLVDFINHKTFYPSRVEFHDYLEWTASHFSEMVEYSAAVVNVRPVPRNGEVALLDVVARRPSGQTVTRRARNVVLAAGLQPVLPPGIERADRVWHSSELLTRLASLRPGEPYSFVVVGAGQSAAEVVGYLHRNFEHAQVHAVFARYGYSVADDTAFANRIFDPAAVDDFYFAPPAVKDQLSAYHSNTNYSVVDADLITDLYRRMYQERVTGHRRLHIHNVCAVAEQAAADGHVGVVIRHLPTGELTRVRAHYVIYATGYTPADPADLLGEAAPLCRRDDVGRVLVDRDYRVSTIPGTRAGIYLQGSTVHTHGISSTLLSNAAVRAGEILDSIRSREPAQSRDPVTALDARG
jgi:L-ornithine N5-monooxygenase